jgi:hypothetical protein
MLRVSLLNWTVPGRADGATASHGQMRVGTWENHLPAACTIESQRKMYKVNLILRLNYINFPWSTWKSPAR